MEGLLIQEKSLHTTTISRNDPAGRMFLHKTQQLFTKSGTTWNLKVDSDLNSQNGSNGIYGQVCFGYYTRLSDFDKDDCYFKHGLRQYVSNGVIITIPEKN
ncbi:MAG: hypothetical protein QXP66_04420 [Candidatus Aenigmatarchaeota archaeon]